MTTMSIAGQPLRGDVAAGRATGFRDGPAARLLGDGRLWLRHGPIEIHARAEGEAGAERAACQRAVRRFAGLLEEVAAELSCLRAAAGPPPWPDGVPGRMCAAAARFDRVFVTPMAAVAGAVAEAVLDAMRGPGLRRVHVNNGGDIALWLAADAAPFRVALVPDPATAAVPGAVVVTSGDGMQGIATSGWRGRSHSLGIADAVTVLAPRAAEADVAATLIANAVDLPGHPAVRRVPARDLAPDSDLGCRPVTVAVGRLGAAELEQALDAGEAVAAGMVSDGRIRGAALALHGVLRIVGSIRLEPVGRGA
ncbi:MAG: UPF0280 family protein [Gemmobacter sp.]